MAKLDLHTWGKSRAAELLVEELNRMPKAPTAKVGKLLEYLARTLKAINCMPKPLRQMQHQYAKIYYYN